MNDQAGQLVMFAMAGARAQAAVDRTIAAVAGTTAQDIIDRAVEEARARTAKDIVQTWNQAAQEIGIPAVRTLTEQRRKKIAARMKEPEFSIERIIEKIRRSAFLKGDNDRGWIVTLDFVIRSEDSYTRILEGMYDGRRNAKRTAKIEPPAGKYDGL